MLKKLNLFILLIFLFSIIISNTAAFAKTIDADTVDAQTAKTIAANQINVSAFGELKNWNGAVPSDPVPLYDQKDKVRSYGFNVIKNGNVIGYVIVNTDKNSSPVPEFGNGSPLPFLVLDQNKRPDALSKLKDNQKLGGVKYIYPSALTYIAEYNVTNGQEQKSKIIFDLRNGKLYENIDTQEPSTEGIDVHRNIKAWDRLEGQSNSLLQATPNNTVVEKTISGVPNYPWYKGCVPTSAGMVLAYWSAHGYPNLPTGNTLIDELATAMGTDSHGNTYVENIPWGINTVASKHGYDLVQISASNDSYGRSYSTWSDWVGQINNTKPLLANMQGSVYGNHTVAGVGYRYDSYQQWIIVHDTWNVSSNVYLDYNSTDVNNPCWTYVTTR